MGARSRAYSLVDVGYVEGRGGSVASEQLKFALIQGGMYRWFKNGLQCEFVVIVIAGT